MLGTHSEDRKQVEPCHPLWICTKCTSTRIVKRPSNRPFIHQPLPESQPPTLQLHHDVPPLESASERTRLPNANNEKKQGPHERPSSMQPLCLHNPISQRSRGAWRVIHTTTNMDPLHLDPTVPTKTPRDEPGTNASFANCTTNR